MDLVDTYGDIAETLLDYVENDRTDLVPEVMRVPAADYLDPDLWQREIDRIFKKLPLMLALSIELAEPGAYKAMDIVGLPVLLTRGKDGKARAFLNVCKHRGMTLVDEGRGQCSRFSCPYHGWTYASDGRLIGVADASKFGPIDKAMHGLTELPCDEQAGLIFAILTPGLPIDVPAFLGGMVTDLAALGLDKYHYLGKREIFGGNWKITYDGYIEAYHFAAAHPETVLPRTLSNVMKFDFFGPHIRMAMPQVRIGRLKDLPREEWGRQEHAAYDFTRALFPNTSIFLAPEMGQIAQLVPGPTPGENRTMLTYICREAPADAAEAERIEEMCRFFGDVTYEEDYLLGLRVQKGLGSGAIKDVVFGRNEVANQHFHRCVRHYLAGDPAAPAPVHGGQGNAAG